VTAESGGLLALVLVLDELLVLVLVPDGLLLL
jgi:hypothetical protein